MTIIKEVQKSTREKKSFRICKKNCLMRQMKLLIFLKKELFRIKVMYLKQKKNQKKNQKKTNFLNVCE